ncbi:MAG: hypothetical protein Q9182_006705 [Xanthomendoza sp. 2 TL-2023]
MTVARINSERSSNRLKSDVPMNRLDIVRYGESGKYSIATQNLNSCHAVAIISRKAAILAHIAPSAPVQLLQAFQTGDSWTKHMMDCIMDCFRANKSHFENQGAGGIIVFGSFQGASVLPDQVQILADKVQNVMKLPAKDVSYKVYIGGDDRDNEANKGAVLVQGNAAGQLPIVWVEENHIPLNDMAPPSMPLTISGPNI